jgi:hypothetical protein
MEKVESTYLKRIINEVMRHKGSQDPVQVSELSKLVPLTDREIRRAVSYLVNKEFYPFGSRSKLPAGFFRIMDVDDFLEAVSNLDPRSRKIKERALNLAKACRQNNIDIPEIHVSKYQDKSKIIVHINNSVVFIGNEKQIIK